MKELTNELINSYIKTGEPLDKAGAYALQHKGGMLIERIEGDYFSAVGLPLNPLVEDLKTFGVYVW